MKSMGKVGLEGGGERERKHMVLEGRYELGRVLGQGSFARVYHARNLETGKSVAMKVVGKEKVVKAGPRAGMNMMEQMKREISVMKRLKHPNIVQLYEVMASKSKVYLAMELVKGGELFTKVSKGGKLSEDGCGSYFRQLISAVDFCHSRGVYHRDLKLENLLLDEEGNLKISDFGLSTFSIDEDEEQQDVLLRTTCGTPHYVAPEVISRRGQGYHGSKADIWSCGIILFVLLAGYLPFHDDNLIKMYRKIYKADFKCPSFFSPQASSLITRMLDPNPDTRITLPQILGSDWYKKNDNDDTKSSGGDWDWDSNKSSKLGGDWSWDSNKSSKLGGDESESLNAFHIISLSHGFDLSPLFDVSDTNNYKKRAEPEREEIRFATTQPASSVISKIEQVAIEAGNFRLRKMGDSVLKLQGEERGRRGRLAIAAHIFSLSPTLLMVEVNKDNGDTREYNHFCRHLLRPALQDIVWTSNN